MRTPSRLPSSDPAAVGRLAFRMFLDRDQRRQIQNPVVSEIAFPGPDGDAAAESLRLTGAWALAPDLLQVRPMFPGALRFLAAQGAALPRPQDIQVVGGHVTDQALDAVALTGRIMVRIQSVDALKTLGKVGVLPYLGEAPTHAWYGPVTLTREFLRTAVLNYAQGLRPAHLYPEGSVTPVVPGAPGWEALAISAFLAGQYEPFLLAGDTPDHDDALRLPMPQVVLIGPQFQLDVTLGWARSRTWAIEPTQAVSVEVVPALAFLQHIRAQLCDPPLAGVVDPVFDAVMDDKGKPWTSLPTRLARLGFGAPSGLTPPDHMVREFQIAASGPRVATSANPMPQDRLDLRQFADLRAVDNADLYSGPVSGRPNQRTRELLRTWENHGYRSPLIIGAFDSAQLDPAGKPLAGPLAGNADLWGREDLMATRPRVFAADFTRTDLATDRIGLSDLDAIGQFSKWQPTKNRPEQHGPACLEPGLKGEHPVAAAEVTSERLLGLTDVELLTRLVDPAAEDLRRRRLSTFKVIRAMAEQECWGYLDRVNAYDGAGISVGLCHWSMAGAVCRPTGVTELGGVAAYLAWLERQGTIAGADLFRTQGLTIDAKQPLDRVVAKRAGNGSYRAQLNFLDDRGEPLAMTKDGPKEYMPSWRSFYRWVQLGRTSAAFGLFNWHMIRRRLRHLLDVPFIDAHLPKDIRQTAGVRPTIGSVFTSEVAVSQILRWHVKRPDDVVVSKKPSGQNTPISQASDHLKSVYAAAAASSPPPADAKAWEAQLLVALHQHVTALKAKGPYKDMARQFEDIADPAWIKPGDPNVHAYGLNIQLRALASEAGTFAFACDIPEPISGA